jgi:hypothetical protein
MKENYLSPILGEVLEPLKRGDEFERDKSLLVPLDMLQQELVFANVRIREVELHL